MIYYADISTRGGNWQQIHVGSIFAHDLPTLKRKASRIANNYFSAADRMDVFYRDPEQPQTEIHAVFHRYNKKAPNNTIRRGAWI